METSEICEFPGCLSLPEYLCECSSEPKKLCTEHLSIHVKDEGKHRILENYIEISDGKSTIISIQCTRSLSKFKSLRENIIRISNKTIQKIIDTTVSHMQKIRELELLFDNTIEYLQKNNKIIKKKSQSSMEDFILKYLNHPDDIYEDLLKQEYEIILKLDIEKKLETVIEENSNLKKNLDLTKLNFSRLDSECKSLRSVYEEVLSQKIGLQEKTDRLEYMESFMQKLIGEDQLKDLLSSEYNSKNMCYFERNSKTLNIISISEVDEKYQLEISDSLDINSGFCELPNNEYFYYAGCPLNFVDFVYIINPSHKTATKRSSGKAKCNIGSCSYYESKVYIFGGQNSLSQEINDAEIYNLNSNTWQDASNLPVACAWISSVVFDKMIMITGFQASTVYNYSIEKNLYSFAGNFTPNRHKVICQGLGKVYVFENGKLHESFDSGVSQYLLINGGTGIPHNQQLISYIIRNQIFVYFILNNKIIYRFNLLTKEIKYIRQITV
jgi:Kelch motif